jgi:DNA (cytosine-5)-methyltransferase 1
MVKLQLLDLFSGIGGFSLGLESTGFFKTIAFVEKDKFCRQVLQKNFNNIPIEEDIRNVRGERYKADIITGGFPCQPFSVAGKRKGTDDDRYLWDETIRVVAECKPRWFIGENVEGIININNGMVLRQVQTDLEEQGFQVQCLVIPASGIGAWHQRKRIWIIAYSHNNGSYRSQGDATKQSSNKQEDRLSFRDDKDVPNTDSEGLQGLWDEYELQQTRKKENIIRSSDDGTQEDVWHSESTGLQSSSDRQRKGKFWGTGTPGEQCQKTWWQIESGICGVPYGLSYELDKDRANRIKALGNSIVPQIARQLGLAIMKAETE